MSTTETNAEDMPEVSVDPNAVSITINGRTVAARKGELIIAAADREGEYIPPPTARASTSRASATTRA